VLIYLLLAGAEARTVRATLLAFFALAAVPETFAMVDGWMVDGWMVDGHADARAGVILGAHGIEPTTARRCLRTQREA
jgi:hypothetical protein